MLFRACVSIFFLALGYFTFGSSDISFLPKDEECQQQGRQCSSDCSAIIFCPPSGPPIVTQNCAISDEFCSVIEGTPQCSNRSDCSGHTQITVRCGSDGLFPDPYNCSSSIMCADGVPTVECHCPDGYYWNTDKNACMDDTFGLEGCCAGKPKTFCDEDHDQGNLGENCNLGYYYVCSKTPDNEYEMYLLRCNPGQIFNGSCVAEEKRHNAYDFGVKEQPACKQITSTTSDTPTTDTPATDTPATDTPATDT